MSAFDPLADLRGILGRRAPTEGRVLSVTGRNAAVSTANGVVSAQLSDELGVRAGDRVRLEGTVITARIANADLPVYVL